jgi:hypothetical protein
MTTSECATDPGLAETSAALVEGTAQMKASKLLKGLLIGFAVSVTIGLGLASWYVGVRIVAANEIAPVSKPVASTVTESPAVPAPAVAPVNSTDALAEAFWSSVAPPPSQLYLEVASLGPLPDSGFVKRLEAKGYRARIETATGQREARILIGPFAERAALEDAERKLQSSGVLAIETAY